MDFEIEKNNIKYFKTVLDTHLEREESAEIIVPDQYPDILRVVDASGLVCLKEKNCRDGRIEMSGTVRASVLYAPDSTNCIKKLETSIPYQAAFDCPELTEQSECCVHVCVHTIDARMVNSRKVSVKVNLKVTVKAYTAAEYELSCDITEAPGVETLKSKVNTYLPIAVKEKNFTIVDDIEIPNSNPPAAELLRVDIRLTGGDARAIGNKVVFKGNAYIRTLYKTGDPENEDGIFTSEHELPFSQILEMEELDEDADCSISLMLCGAELEIQPNGQGQSYTIGATLNLNASGVAWMSREIQTISDVYSVNCDILPETQMQTMKNLIEKAVRRQTAREVIETGVTPASVLTVSVLVDSPVLKTEGDRAFLTANSTVSVVYMGEDSTAYNSTRNIPVVCPVELPEGAGCDCTAAFAGDTFATIASGGIEVRFSVDFDVTVTNTEKVTCITNLKVDQLQESDVKRPSVVLRHTKQGEKLWDIAKNYRTTVADVMSANGLEEADQAMDGRLLLIARKR